MPAQARARSIANAQLLPQRHIVQSALLKITQRLGIAVKLVLIERYRFLKHSGRVDDVNWRSTLLPLEVAQAFTEG